MLYGEVKRDVTEMELTQEEIGILQMAAPTKRRFIVEDGRLILVTVERNG